MLQDQKTREKLYIFESKKENCLFEDGMIVYVENPKESIKEKKAMEVRDGFSNILGCKFKIQKSITSPSYICGRQNNTSSVMSTP